MFSLDMVDVGQDRFDVVRVLICEYQLSHADAKMILAGVRTRIITAELSRVRAVQEKLDALGAETVIEMSNGDADQSGIEN